MKAVSDKDLLKIALALPAPRFRNNDIYAAMKAVRKARHGLSGVTTWEKLARRGWIVRTKEPLSGSNKRRCFWKLGAYPTAIIALQAIKLRLHFVGMPQEPMLNGRTAWADEIRLLEAALAQEWDS